jgi:hypothetical protein
VLAGIAMVRADERPAEPDPRELPEVFATR